MPQQHKHRFAVLGLSVLSLAMLAGCSGLDDSDIQTTGKNENPVAVLNSSQDTAWTGETITFDAKGSKDDDGRIVSYTYSFGDGTSAEGADEDASVEHTYLRGGEYIVTLTVTDDGNDRAGALSDTDTVEITVNEEVPVASAVVAAEPLDETSEMNQTFEVYKSADRFELELQIQGNLVTGASEIEIRVTDPEGDVIATKQVTVQGTDEDTVDLNGLLTDEGTHRIEVEANSGSATVSGVLKIFYGSEDNGDSDDDLTGGR